MIGNCKDCKHWEAATVSTYSPFGKESGTCNLASSRDGRTENTETLAVAQDHDQYSAWLETKPDFGCVMFEPRPEDHDEGGK